MTYHCSTKIDCLKCECYVYSSNPHRNNYFFPNRVLGKILEPHLVCVVCPCTLGVRERMLPEGSHQKKGTPCTDLFCGFVLVHGLFLGGPWEHGREYLDTFIVIWKGNFMSVESNKNWGLLFCMYHLIFLAIYFLFCFTKKY